MSSMRTGFRGIARVAVLAVALKVSLSATVNALSELEALEAVDRFMAAWNSREPMAFAQTLHYPHVRPRAGALGRVYESAEDYARGIDFDAVVRSGWEKSRFDSTRVVHLSDHKAHVAGRYSRWRADGTRLYTTQVTYIVTEREDSVGVQARLPAGLEDLNAEEKAATAAAAIALVEEYLRAFNARDEEAWTATFHYPHIRIAGDRVDEWPTAEAYEEQFDFDRFSEQFNWHHSTWDSIEPVQVGRNAVNLALVFSRWDEEGRKLATFETYYLVTLEEGRWGVRARSSFAP